MNYEPNIDEYDLIYRVLVKVITSMNQITLARKLGTLSSVPHITIIFVQLLCARLGHACA